MDSFITTQVHGIAMHSRKESPFAQLRITAASYRLDTIQTEQLDLQKAFKREKADDSNAMHNSRRKNSPVERNLSDGTEDSIEMHAKPDLNCLCV